MRIEKSGSTEAQPGTAIDRYLSWALDTTRGWPDNEQIQFGSQQLYDQVVGELAEVGSYTTATPPDMWGLDVQSRDMLSGVIDGKVDCIRQAVDWLNDNQIACAYLPYVAYQTDETDETDEEWTSKPNPATKQTIRIRRVSSGVESTCARAVVGNKSGMQLVQIATDLKKRIAHLACIPTNASGANQGWGVKWLAHTSKMRLSGTNFGQSSGRRYGGDYEIPNLSGETVADLELTYEGVKVNYLDEDPPPPPADWDTIATEARQEVARWWQAAKDSNDITAATVAHSIDALQESLRRLHELMRGNVDPNKLASTGLRRAADQAERFE